MVAMSAVTARVLFALAAALARLPWPWLRVLADGLAALMVATDVRESTVALRNLEIALPELDAPARDRLHRAVVRTTARQALETLRLWTRPPADSLALVREATGVEAFDAACASGRGVIVLAPHHGNWELLNRWLASRTPLAILYKPPESAVGEAFLRLVRADADAARVEQVRAEGAGVRQLFKRLRDGGVIGVLPDQQPKGGDGVFAPFFGIEALTMTLAARLAARSDATVLFAWCERIDDDLGFALRVAPAPAGIADDDPRVAATALNAAVEAIARRDPAQYQWTYKRFKARPPGSGEPNPYRELEGRSR